MHTFLWLGFLVSAEVCKQNPNKVVVQLTQEKCECCEDLDDYIQDYDYVYILFYSKVGRLNADILEKFHSVAEGWKHSRIRFGKIDVDSDREMAVRWVDPNMIPTNIMWKFGRPVEVSPKDFEYIRDHYRGAPDGQKWMLNKYLNDKTESIHYVQPLEKPKQLTKLLKRFEVAVVGVFPKEDKNWRRFHKVVWQLHRNGDEAQDYADAGVGFAATKDPEVRKKIEGAKAPSVVVYVDGAVLEEDVFAPEKWTDEALLTFISSFLPIGDDFDEKRPADDL
jgi:hypothetical protein